MQYRVNASETDNSSVQNAVANWKRIVTCSARDSATLVRLGLKELREWASRNGKSSPTQDPEESTGHQQTSACLAQEQSLPHIQGCRQSSTVLFFVLDFALLKKQIQMHIVWNKMGEFTTIFWWIWSFRT